MRCWGAQMTREALIALADWIANGDDRHPCCFRDAARPERWEMSETGRDCDCEVYQTCAKCRPEVVSLTATLSAKDRELGAVKHELWRTQVAHGELALRLSAAEDIVHEGSDALTALRAQVAALEAELRHEWWMKHGHHGHVAETQRPAPAADRGPDRGEER
jgi:hypothetical protein